MLLRFEANAFRGEAGCCLRTLETTFNCVRVRVLCPDPGGEVQLRPQPDERIRQGKASQVVRLFDVGACHRGGYIHRGWRFGQHPLPGGEAEKNLKLILEKKKNHVVESCYNNSS